MYKLAVGKNSAGREAVTAQKCRISAVSSADFCLGDRMDPAPGRIEWRGRARAIRRLFRAEGLDCQPLQGLSPFREYTVVFQRQSCA